MKCLLEWNVVPWPSPWWGLSEGLSLLTPWAGSSADDLASVCQGFSAEGVALMVRMVGSGLRHDWEIILKQGDD